MSGDSVASADLEECRHAGTILTPGQGAAVFSVCEVLPSDVRCQMLDVAVARVPGCRVTAECGHLAQADSGQPCPDAAARATMKADCSET